MKKYFLLLLFLIGICAVANAQNNTDEISGKNAEYSFDSLDEKPSFPGGSNSLLDYLSTNINYPKKALKKGITGKVFVQFVIDKNGKITDVEAVRGVDRLLDKEAVRVIKAMPAWKPGYKDGVPVRVKYTIPINFKY